MDVSIYVIGYMVCSIRGKLSVSYDLEFMGGDSITHNIKSLCFNLFVLFFFLVCFKKNVLKIL